MRFRESKVGSLNFYVAWVHSLADVPQELEAHDGVLESPELNQTMKTRLAKLLTAGWCFLSLAMVAGVAQNWTNTTTFGFENMRIYSSLNGMILYVPGATGSIYFSTNAGITWNTNNTPAVICNALAFSADGKRMVSLGNNISPLKSEIYTSTNGGALWVSNNAPNKYWSSVASSADGNKFVAAAGHVVSNFYPANTWGIYTFTNGWSSWISNNLPSKPWTCVASSADGNKLVATSVGSIYTTTNAGLSWVSNNVPNYYWVSVASSADGDKLVAAASSGLGNSQSALYTSTNGGTDWVFNNVLVGQVTVASSTDGDKLISVSRSGFVNTSTNAGATWISTLITNNVDWTFVTSSADGNRLAAIGARGSVFVSYSTPTPSLSIANIGSNTRLSWIIPSLPFTLQGNTDLTTTNWMDVTNQPILNLNNLENELALPLPPASIFYRLKSNP